MPYDSMDSFAKALLQLKTFASKVPTINPENLISHHLVEMAP
jgi:hypothetical protein